MQSIALNSGLSHLRGRISDIDSHEMMPAQEWAAQLGSEFKPLVDYFVAKGESERDNANSANIPDFPGDILPVTADIVNVKGSRAPGAVSPHRRLDVIDAMGVSRQLLFSTVAVFAVALYKSAANPDFMREIGGDRRKLARSWLDCYNAWLEKNALGSDRIRPVALLYGDTPHELITMADRLLRAGFRAVQYLPANELPGQRSPAHPDLDPLWARLAEANCTFTLHIEGEGETHEQNGWRNAPAFQGFYTQGEFSTDPAKMAAIHLPFENFLSIMVLGGVFERHPTLRMGIIEVGGYWIGPLMSRLDMWHRIGRKFDRGDAKLQPTYRLPQTPSHYIKQNVRVTPFPFEDVTAHISAFDVSDVLCFSTDYPHLEGGKDAFAIFHKNLGHLGDEIVERFFVRNGELLLPP